MGTPATPAPQDPQDAGLARLVAAGTLTPEQAEAVRAELGIGHPDRVAGAARAVEGTAGAAPVDRGDTPWTAILAEVGAYIGAAFVGGAAVALTGPSWDDLPTTTQFLLLAGPALLLVVAAVAVALSVPGRWSPREAQPGTGPRRRLVSALVVVASSLAAGAAAVVAPLEHTGTAAALTGLAVAGLGYVACRSPLLHLATAVGALGALYAVWDDAGWYGPATGIAIVVLGVAWAALSLAGVLAERALGLGVGAVLVFVGGETLVVESSTAGDVLGYGVLVALVVAGLGGYVLLRQVPLLVAGAFTLAVVVPQVVLDYAGGELGAAGALLLSGLSIVGASVLALRLRSAAPAS
jgi:hypothetical protein